MQVGIIRSLQRTTLAELVAFDAHGPAPAALQDSPTAPLLN